MCYAHLAKQSCIIPYLRFWNESNVTVPIVRLYVHVRNILRSTEKEIEGFHLARQNGIGELRGGDGGENDQYQPVL